jgi:hypothetical protein
MNPSAIMPHVRSIDAPPVTSERTTGGNGSSLEGRPTHTARNTMSASGKHESGRKKARVSAAIFLADTPVLPALLPLGASPLSFIVGDMWNYDMGIWAFWFRALWVQASGVMLVVSGLPGEAEAMFIYLADSITNERFKNTDTLCFLCRHGKLACQHLRWYR